MASSAEFSFNLEALKARTCQDSQDKCSTHIGTNGNKVLTENKGGLAVGSRGWGKTGLGDSRRCSSDRDRDSDSVTSKNRFVPNYLSQENGHQ